MSNKFTKGPWMCPTASASKYGFPRWEVGYQDGDLLGCVAGVGRMKQTSV